MDVGIGIVIAAIGAAVTAPLAYIKAEEEKERRRKAKKKRKKRPRDIYDDLLDLEFCPGMQWTFETLYSQRRQFMRICSRFGAVRHRVDNWRVDVIADAIETTDKTLEYNIGQCLNLVVMAGYNPKMGFYQPDFKKEAINRDALRSYLGENAEVLEKLDELITISVESSWHRAEFTAAELEAWSSGFKNIRSFEQDFEKRKGVA